MTEIPRLVIHEFVTLLKRSLPDRPKRDSHVNVVIEATGKQLSLSAQHADGAIRYQTAAILAPCVFCLPAKWLAQAEGRTGSVTVERKSSKVEMRWVNHGIPYTVDCNPIAPATPSTFPADPTSWVENPPSMLKAFDDAAHVAAQESARYSLSKIQLRGNGEIVASDGKQLLMQNGFKFPWKDSVLVPRMTLFSAGVLPKDQPVHVGRTSTNVAFKVGDWTIWMSMDNGGRYPAVEQVFPTKIVSTLHFTPGDTAVLLRSLKSLPGSKEENAPVTVECNSQVVIRAKDGDTKPVELVLEQISSSGKPIRFCTSRHLLLRAMQLGFSDIQIQDADTPMLCKDEHRKYVWMPLPKSLAIAATEDAVRIVPDKKVKPARKTVSRKPISVKPARVVPAPAAEVPPPIEAVLPQKQKRLAAAFARTLTACLQTVLGRCLVLMSSLLRHRHRR